MRSKLVHSKLVLERSMALVQQQERSMALVQQEHSMVLVQQRERSTVQEPLRNKQVLECSKLVRVCSSYGWPDVFPSGGDERMDRSSLHNRN